jgi:glycosyltransferase involved in cell wall biosynthesis
MRILSLYYTHKPGGFCKRLYRLLSALGEAGHEVYYLSLDPPPASLSPKITWRRIPFPSKRRSGFVFWGCFTFWAVFYTAQSIIRIKPQRIVVFNPYYAFISRMGAALGRCTIVLFVRARPLPAPGSEYLSLSQLPQLVFERLGLCAADRIVCQTESARAAVSKHVSRTTDLRILPNDIPVTISTGPRRRSFHFPLVALTTGVFVDGKNICLLIDAFWALETSEGPGRFCLLVAGQGPALREAEQLVAQRHMKSVTFLGWRDDLPQLFEGSDIMLHPSRSEGMPNSVLEALGAGLPVLASRIPEIQELLESDDLLFDSATPAELIEKLKEISRNSELLKRYGEFCQRRAKLFSFDWTSAATKNCVG